MEKKKYVMMFLQSFLSLISSIFPLILKKHKSLHTGYQIGNIKMLKDYICPRWSKKIFWELAVTGERYRYG